MVDYNSSEKHRGPTFYTSIRFLPYDTQHALLNTVQRLLEESCFEFAKMWLPNDRRVKLWTTPTQFEISKWRDIFGKAYIPSQAFDTTLDVPLKLLFQEATSLRNNAVHRSPVLVDSLLKMLSSAIQLTRMLRHQTRQTKIQTLSDHLKDGLCARAKNRARATEKYERLVADIDQQKKPLLMQLNKLDKEQGDAAMKFEQDALHHDSLLQGSMTKFINQIIHNRDTADYRDRTLRGSNNETPVDGSQTIRANLNAVAAEKFSGNVDDTRHEANTGTIEGDGDIQFISKCEFDDVTLAGRLPRTKTRGGANKLEATRSRESKTSPKQDPLRPSSDSLSLQSPFQGLISNESNVQLQEGCATKMTESCPNKIESGKDNDLQDKSASDMVINNGTSSTSNPFHSESLYESPDIRLSGPLVKCNQIPLIKSLVSTTRGSEEHRAQSSSNNAILGDLIVAKYQPAIDLESSRSTDKPDSHTFLHDEFEENMVNDVCDLHPNSGHDILRSLEEELESQLMSTINEATLWAESATYEEILRVSVSNDAVKSKTMQIGSPIVEFGKPWKPADNGLPFSPNNGEIQQENCSKRLLRRKRKMGSPLSPKTAGSCNSLFVGQSSQSVFGSCLFTGVDLNATKGQYFSFSNVPTSVDLMPFGAIKRPKNM